MGQENWYLQVTFDGAGPPLKEEIPLRGASTEPEALIMAEGQLMEAKKRHRGRVVSSISVVSWPSRIKVELNAPEGRK